MKCPHCGKSMSRYELIKELSELTGIEEWVFASLSVTPATKLIEAFKRLQPNKKPEVEKKS